MGLLDRIRRNRAWRIDVAKAAVLREMAAVSLFRDTRAASAPRLGALHALLDDDDALLAHYESKAGAMSEATTGGELSEVER